MSFLFSGNLWLLRNPPANKSALCLCDWELCCLHVPQRDAITFILFSFFPFSSRERTVATWWKYIEHYRQELMASLAGREADLLRSISDRNLFNKIIVYQALEILMNRMFEIGAMPEESVKTVPHGKWLENCLSFIEASADQAGLF